MEERKILNLLADSYNGSFESIELLRKGGCVAYKVCSEENRFFMKVIPPAFLNTAKQSLSILMYLEEKGFPCPQVILSKNGLPYVEIDEPDDRAVFVLFKYIEGREPDEGEDIETIGMLVGRLHSVMRGYKGSLPEKGREFFIDRYINILKKKNYNESKIKIFSEYGDFLWEKIKNLPRGFCHGDMHRGNLLKTSSDKYYILDFDTSCNAFPIYDIMIMCNSTDYFNFDEKGYERSKNTYESFLKGYTKFCTINEEELKAFYDLIAIYHYQLQATIIEIYGLDCVDEKFFDLQLEWLLRWRDQCTGC